MKEIWKDIDGFEGLYKISNLGNVYSYISNRLLNPRIDNFGRRGVHFYQNKKECCFRIHRLVAQHFIPNPNNYPEVNHIDGNKMNDRIDNLEWCTGSQNVKHAFKLGLMTRGKGEDCGKSKLTNHQVLKIRELYSKGWTYVDIAKKFKKSRTCIRLICIRGTWKHI